MTYDAFSDHVIHSRTPLLVRSQSLARCTVTQAHSCYPAGITASCFTRERSSAPSLLLGGWWVRPGHTQDVATVQADIGGRLTPRLSVTNLVRYVEQTWLYNCTCTCATHAFVFLVRSMFAGNRCHGYCAGTSTSSCLPYSLCCSASDSLEEHEEASLSLRTYRPPCLHYPSSICCISKVMRTRQE